MNKLLFTIFIFFSLILINGCTPNSTSSNVSDKSIKVAVLGQPAILNPFTAVKFNTADPIAVTFRPLWDWNDRWELQPVSAAEPFDQVVRRSKKGTLAFKATIAPDIRWSNGLYLNANDFVFSTQVAYYPTISIFNDFWLSKVNKLTATQKYTIDMMVSYPSTLFINRFLPIPASIVENKFLSAPDKWIAAPKNLINISNGPYKIKNISLSKGFISSIDCVVNSEYLRHKPAISSMKISYMQRPTLETALSSEIFDYIPSLPKELADFLKSNPKYEIRNIVTPALHLLYFNEKKIPEFQVRKALSSSIDRSEIANSVNGEKCGIADSLLHPNHPAALHIYKNYPAAELLMKKAGYKKGASGWAKAGKTLNLCIMYDKYNQKEAELIQKQLLTAGFHSQLLTYDPKQVHLADICLMLVDDGPWVTPNTFMSTSVKSSIFSAQQYVKSPFTSDLIQNAKILNSYFIGSSKQQQKLFMQQQKLLYSEAMVLPLAFNIKRAAISKRILNYAPRGFGSDLWNLEYWDLAKE